MTQTAAAHTDTRQKIIEAMLSITAREGFDNATTQQISNQAGVSEGIIYHYFRSKEELYVNMIKEKASEFRGRVIGSLSGIDSPKDKLERLIELHVKFATSEGSFFRILFNKTGGKPLMIKHGLKFGIIPYAEIIEGIIRDGMDKGDFKKVDPKVTSYNIIGMMQIALIPILLGEVSYTGPQVRENIRKILLGGLLK
jgi:TetR/AcrR family fatty acid metabolism transcriptional regulator